MLITSNNINELDKEHSFLILKDLCFSKKQIKAKKIIIKNCKIDSLYLKNYEGYLNTQLILINSEVNFLNCILRGLTLYKSTVKKSTIYCPRKLTIENYNGDISDIVFVINKNNQGIYLKNVQAKIDTYNLDPSTKIKFYSENSNINYETIPYNNLIKKFF